MTTDIITVKTLDEYAEDSATLLMERIDEFFIDMNLNTAREYYKWHALFSDFIVEQNSK